MSIYTSLIALWTPITYYQSNIVIIAKRNVLFSISAFFANIFHKTDIILVSVSPAD